MSSSFVALARLRDIPDRGVLAVEAPGGERLCLIRLGAQVTATRDACPHQAFPLSSGEVLDDDTLQCGWHGARFDCRNGAVRQGPATDPLEMFDVRLDGDVILVRGPGT